ncbi:hypothetical protein ASPZODRAFT_140517 [Penicilliopsis zonata CBS 506.65]|uniref:MGS207 protein n=1 Tax=Penicilliopsis zonata CBS 506.65 TaxID=1073090 RepID=A0A1L9SM77_9EURO|nr:hypothetical protein ASPZODRAFT_140517 [Penicilliopsis zonata CBS 506.65]OJJ48201.1 hypothetical protein ASPZODRAFT_140517 [Penicilliopsis zonata CBS 506.65]
MFSISLPSLQGLWPSRSEKGVDIASVKIHDIQNAQERPASSLRHLLKLNHADNAVLYNGLRSQNQMSHVLSSSYLLGATQHDLNRIYEVAGKDLEHWEESPSEVCSYDWRDFLGKRNYQQAYINFFDDELVRLGYDWRQVVHDYLLTGEKPLINSMMSDLGHPIIHLAYAYEMSSREMATEALGLAATCYSDLHKYLEDPSYVQTEAAYHSASLFEILERVRADKSFDNLSDGHDGNTLDSVFQARESELLGHWNAWKIDDPIKQFRESQELAAALFVSTTPKDSKTDTYSLLLVHVLTTSHAVRILLPFLPARFQLSLVRQWLLVTLAIYIAQLRPQIDLDSIRSFNLEGRDWKSVAYTAVQGAHATDPHYLKAIRALREAADTWGDPDQFYLKAAVQFAHEFSGWS